MRYDDPNYLIVRYANPNDAYVAVASVATGVPSVYTGSTLRIAQKAAILGVNFQINSGPASAVGTNSISVARVVLGGAASTWKTHTLTTSLGASMLNDTVDISLASAMTVSSVGDVALLIGNAASLHKCVLIKNITWRYRILPGTSDLPGAATPY